MRELFPQIFFTIGIDGDVDNMKEPFFHGDSIAASGNIRTPAISLVKTRTLSVTFELYFGASIDADAQIDAYFSPDGKHWDTIAYTTWAITYTVSTRVKRTVLIDVPEHGFIDFKITNGSAADTINDIFGWYSIESYNKK